MTISFPPSLSGLAAWATENGVDGAEARVRFAQYGVLRAIAASNVLGPALVLKGGNALDFVWQPNRSTQDLDFSVDATGLARPLDTDVLARELASSLVIAGRALDINFAVHGVRQQPPGSDKTFVTYEARVGYALADEYRLRVRMTHGETSPHVVPLDVSLNEPICADQRVSLGDAVELRVSTLEDIVAEKLRALLQQPIRNRQRRQDLLDIAVIVRSGTELDLAFVAAFLLEKAAARDVPVSRPAFTDPEVTDRARIDYAELEATTRRSFVPFDEALTTLHELVARLAIPDEA